MPYIQSIGLAQAPYKHLQSDILEFMLGHFYVPDEDVEKVRRLYARSEIHTRHSAIEDFSLDKNSWTFFKTDQPTTVTARMNQFFEVAPDLCLKAIQNAIPESAYENITHLITVTCTGLAAPGLDIHVIRALSLNPYIQRSAVNFMGCYAAIHALKAAHAICASQPDAQVLIVDVELCTLHFQDEYTMDNIASSLLFGDGAAAALVNNEGQGYRLDDFFSMVALKGYDDMAWTVTEQGFQMALSSYIPGLIAEEIKPLLDQALTHRGHAQSDIQHWAIHPGGKKILTEIEKVLELPASALNCSRSVLHDYGNMSSVTLFFILERMSASAQKGDRVFGAAFGPGLTLESLFLTVC
ncbi:MAG: type III polyketide synthase [Chitinophagaceae bacterium]|nr:type III polyketide synthase [Chitinophagaceae bacterium]